MEKVLIKENKETVTQEIGCLIKNKEMVKKFMLMALNILENFDKVSDMEMDKCSMLTVVVIKENLLMISLKGKEVIIEVTERYIWGNGKKIRCMVEELICGMMGRFIVEISCRIAGRATGSWFRNLEKGI